MHEDGGRETLLTGHVDDNEAYNFVLLLQKCREVSRSPIFVLPRC